MSSQHEAYDQALLDEAPAATRAQRQEGYNVDLLDSRPTRPLSTQPLQPTPPPITPRVTDIESFSKENIVPPIYAQKSTQSFWRSRNGFITMFVIAVVVLGAVIGGAVGETVGKNSNNGDIQTPGIQSDTPSSSLTSASPTARSSSSASSTAPSGAGGNGAGFSSTSPTSSAGPLNPQITETSAGTPLVSEASPALGPTGG